MSDAQVQAQTQTQDPMLGWATTENLFRELICRFSIPAPGSQVSARVNIERALFLAEMLGGLSTFDREYKTVGNGNKAV